MFDFDPFPDRLDIAELGMAPANKQPVELQIEAPSASIEPSAIQHDINGETMADDWSTLFSLDGLEHDSTSLSTATFALPGIQLCPDAGAISGVFSAPGSPISTLNNYPINPTDLNLPSSSMDMACPTNTGQATVLPPVGVAETLPLPVTPFTTSSLAARPISRPIISANWQLPPKRRGGKRGPLTKAQAEARQKLKVTGGACIRCRLSRVKVSFLKDPMSTTPANLIRSALAAYLAMVVARSLGPAGSGGHLARRPSSWIS